MREMNESHSAQIARPPNDHTTFDVNQNILLIISIHRKRSGRRTQQESQKKSREHVKNKIGEQKSQFSLSTTQ